MLPNAACHGCADATGSKPMKAVDRLRRPRHAILAGTLVFALGVAVSSGVGAAAAAARPATVTATQPADGPPVAPDYVGLRRMLYCQFSAAELIGEAAAKDPN